MNSPTPITPRSIPWEEAIKILEAPIQKDFLVSRKSEQKSTSEIDENIESTETNEEGKGKRKEPGPCSTCSNSPCCCESSEQKKTSEKPHKKQKNHHQLLPHQVLCPKISNSEECPYGDKCKFQHNIEEYLKNKDPDIGNECYNFRKRGWCRYGLRCRFGGDHIKDGKNIRKEDNTDLKEDKEFNFFNKDLQYSLYRKEYQFPLSEKLIEVLQPNSQHQRIKQKKINKEKAQAISECNPSEQKYTPTQENQEQNSTIEKKDEPQQQQEEEKSTPLKSEEQSLKKNKVSEEFMNDVETRLRPEEKKKIDFKGKLYLAPLTTLGNLPFRRICKEYGADITCGEMAMATNLLKGQPSEWALLRKHSSETCFGVQICGSYMDSMTTCAELIEKEVDIDFVDINAGCPIDLVYNKGAGSALLERTKKLELIMSGMSQVLKCPLTIKTRIGKDEKSPNLHRIIASWKDCGVSAVCIHGRSRQQRYTRLADWDYVNKCRSLTDLQLIGNGDIFTYEDYNQHVNIVDCQMIARGALIKPWLFTEIKEQRHWDISSSERLEFIKRFVNYGLDHWGSDHQGVSLTRNFLLEWLSFLYRYIPVGLLEVLPPTMRWRPSPYYGRDLMETKLASPNVSDWISLSEMFLGKVPPNFHFTPKHKSNSYTDTQG